jgi:outer membrane protein OmpA-like peptidoglycan-associated protein
MRSFLALVLVLAACGRSPPARSPAAPPSVSAAALPFDATTTRQAPPAREDHTLCGYAELPSIPFDKGSVLVMPDEDAIIERLARCLTAPPMQSARVVLVGRTEAQSGAACSAELGLRRAERVKQFFVAHGMPAERIVTASAGDLETPLVVPTARVDVIVAFPQSVAQ